MHTFFVNTSGNPFENYSDFFEIQHETRQLVSLDCPLDKWHDTQRGFVACVEKMGQLIDTYKDLNNDFNLILYVDLVSCKAYTDIPMGRHRERYACLKALRSVLRHYIASTLVRELDERGRAPREVLVIFEENALPDDADERTEDGKNLIRSYAGNFLGLPAVEKLDALLYEQEAPSLTAEAFCAQIQGPEALCQRILETYIDEIDTFLQETKAWETAQQPLCAFLDRVVKLADVQDKAVAEVSFVTNRRAGIANKQEKTRRNLRLCFYLMSCVDAQTVYDRSGEDPVAKAFSQVDWKEVAEVLVAKNSIYQSKYKELGRIEDSFSELQLSPPLYAFNHDRFGLDRFGKRGKNLKIVNVEKKEKQSKQKEQQEQNDAEPTAIQPELEKEVAVDEAQGRCLFTQEEYPLFDYQGDNYDESILKKKASTEQYLKEAKSLRRHHLDYLQRLKIHISDRLSNYAGRSPENEPALLRKRAVSFGQVDLEDAARDYRYTYGSKNRETQKLNTVMDISQTAYTSMLLDYMEFCASRSVAVTDVEDQCNWFVTRVHQIQESLRKIGLAAACLTMALLALYIPFVVLQWEAIIANPVTIVVALASILIPVLILLAVCGIATIHQRKKYIQAWKDYKDKSNQSLGDNALAVEKYDKLLTVYIPALRWVYEYKLDVEFYADCCKMARAKLAHHSQKLRDRIEAISNVIEDLESDDCSQADVAEKVRQTDDAVDYNVSFCSGKKNKKFYSIVDSKFLKSIHQ